MHLELDTLAQIGLMISFAYIVGQIFRQIGIPQVVGFLVAGMFLGPSFFNLIPHELQDNLGFISELALGLIGFEMGSHLRFDSLRRLGKSIVWITVLEAFTAFTLVGVGVYLVTGNNALALLLGAIAASTAPAATMEVLNEYKAEGPFTTTLLAVIGIDDTIAILMFSFAATAAETLLAGGSSISLLDVVMLPFIEIGGSIIVGIMMGWIMNTVLKRMEMRYEAIVLPIGIGMVTIGLANTLHLSLILTTMAMGMMVINLETKNDKHITFIVDQVGPVMYILFFALAGAGLHIDVLPSIGLIGVVYVVGRGVGKFAGAYTGASLGGASKTVRNYLGLALFSQAGVAIGLAMEAGERFSALGPEGVALATLVVNVVTATVFVAEIAGPILVKLSITKAGEVGQATPDCIPQERERKQPESEGAIPEPGYAGAGN